MKNLMKWSLLCFLLISMFMTLGQNAKVKQYLNHDTSIEPIKRAILKNPVKTIGCLSGDTDINKEPSRLEIKTKKVSLHQKAAELNAAFRAKGVNEYVRVILVGDKEVLQVQKRSNKEDYITLIKNK